MTGIASHERVQSAAIPDPDGLSSRALALLRDALVWDAHGGFWPTPDLDLNQLSLWSDAHVDFLSINIGFDACPWEDTIRNVAAFRHWLQQRPDRFVLVETTADVLRARREAKLAIAFDIEGACCFAGQVSMLALYHRLGVRQAHFVYNRNNEAGGGCHDEDQGLTEFGRALLMEANRLGVLVDLSHVGYRTSMEIMEQSTAPVVYSHANPKALAEHPRNITDEQMRACVATGGIIAVTGAGRFLGDPAASSASFVRAIDMTVQRVGASNVGIGLDYTWLSSSIDRSPIFWPPQFYTGNFACQRPDQLPEIAELLLRQGYPEADIRGILGTNYLRLAEQVWAPGETAGCLV